MGTVTGSSNVAARTIVPDFQVHEIVLAELAREHSRHHGTGAVAGALDVRLGIAVTDVFVEALRCAQRRVRLTIDARIRNLRSR